MWILPLLNQDHPIQVLITYKFTLVALLDWVGGECDWINTEFIFAQAAGLYFRGQRIWQAAMEDLKSKGMRYAKQVYLWKFSGTKTSAVWILFDIIYVFPF